jgi:hypothetical protein
MWRVDRRSTRREDGEKRGNARSRSSLGALGGFYPNERV